MRICEKAVMLKKSMVCVRQYVSPIRFANFFVRMFFKEKRFFFAKTVIKHEKYRRIPF